MRHEVGHHLGWDERGVRGLGLLKDPTREA